MQLPRQPGAVAADLLACSPHAAQRMHDRHRGRSDGHGTDCGRPAPQRPNVHVAIARRAAAINSGEDQP